MGLSGAAFAEDGKATAPKAMSDSEMDKVTERSRGLSDVCDLGRAPLEDWRPGRSPLIQRGRAGLGSWRTRSRVSVVRRWPCVIIYYLPWLRMIARLLLWKRLCNPRLNLWNLARAEMRLRRRRTRLHLSAIRERSSIGRSHWHLLSGQMKRGSGSPQGRRSFWRAFR